MRYFITAGMMLLFVPTAFIHAQTVNEATLSAGIYSRYRAQELREGSSVMTGPFGQPYKRSNVADAGAYFLSFQRWLVPQFTLGFTMGIEQERGTFEEIAGSPAGTYRKRSLSLAVEVRYYYVRRGVLRLYSMAGAGPHFYQQLTSYSSAGNPTILDNNSMSISPTYQVSPLGIRYGHRLGGFAEIGWGYKGAIKCGRCAAFFNFFLTFRPSNS